RGDEPPDVGEATRSWSPHRENGMQHHLGGIEIVYVEGGERPPDGFSKRTTDTPVEALQQPRCVEVLGEPSAYFVNLVAVHAVEALLRVLDVGEHAVGLDLVLEPQPRRGRSAWQRLG